MDKLKKNNSNLESFQNDEIKIKFIWRFLFRNKKLIGFFSFIFFVLAIPYSLTLKKVWEGQFQIVLNSGENVSGLNINPALQNILGNSGDGSKNNLRTEVGILQSPSLLMPIFDFVVNSQKLNESNKKLSFYKWEKALDIELEKGTSILNISYRDKDKKLILPVLKKISVAYQEYSSKNKKRQQEITRKYLLGQISKYKENSSNSLKAAQDFAIDQDLIYFDFNYLENKREFGENELSLTSSNFLIPNIGIENVRVNAANKIRIIDQQIIKINEISNDLQKLKYIDSTISAFEDGGLPKLIEDLEAELVEKRLYYTEDDMDIKRLVEKRDLFIDLLKERTLGILKGRRIEFEAAMEAAMRPKGVLLKHKELIREASRDESTLIALENQLRINELERAKDKEPWELITKPTLLSGTVGLSKKSIGFLGLLSGLILGSIIAFYREKKSNIIFDYEILEELYSTEVIEEFGANDIEINSKKILFLKEYIISKFEGNVNLISLDEKNIKLIENLIKVLNDKNINFDLITTYQEFKKISKTDNNLVVLKNFSAKYKDIKIIKKYLEILNVKLAGIILFDKTIT